MKEYCYSWDGENDSSGIYDSELEALKFAKQDNPDADEVWVGIAVKHKLRWNSNEETIIDSMQENLDEVCGEYAENGLDSISNEQEVDLAKMIDATVKLWIEKHKIEPPCYTVIDCGLHELN